jgi:hypothetical protein
MTSVYQNVLSAEDITYLNHLPEVIEAKAKLDSRSSGVIYFSVTLTDEIRNTLQIRFGLNLSTNTIPMRWIKGDTRPHVDIGASDFQNTYLLYLNDSPGELVVDSSSYPIEANTGFVFNEGVEHETLHTENIPRLLLGPMNEFAQSVGIGVSYYPTEADALAYTNWLGNGSSFTIGDGGPFGGYTSWRIASNSGGSSPQNVVYVNGDVLIEDGSYYLYPSTPCFLEGTTILCQVDGVERYIPVEQLKNGTLVKTSLDGYKAVVLLGKATIENPGNDDRTENRLYRCAVSKYPHLKEDLYITGCHSILEFPITEKQKEDTISHMGKLFVTDNKYRLLACVDERAEPWNSEGTYNIWHFALENENDKRNYGVYANGGLLVETTFIYFLKHKSNMTIVE